MEKREVMEIQRDRVLDASGNVVARQSPKVQLYGGNGNVLLGPLSLCSRESGSATLLSLSPGVLRGAKVLDGGGGGLGEIGSYDWPPQDLNDVNPVVEVLVTFNAPANWATDTRGTQVTRGDRLRLQVIDAATGALQTLPTFELELEGGLGPHPYPTPNCRVQAYLVRPTNTSPSPAEVLEGARVVRADNGDLVGMLLVGSGLLVHPTR